MNLHGVQGSLPVLGPYPPFMAMGILRLLYSLDQMKQIIVQIVKNDNRNNSVKFEKDSPFCF